MPAKNEEYARSVSTLNKIFALSSLALLLGTLWMVWDDYARPWKRTQRQFRTLAARKALEAVRQAEQAVNTEALRQVLDQLNAAEAQSERRRKDHEALLAKLAAIDVRAYVLDRDTKNAKSVYDAARFQFEELAEHRDPGAPSAAKRLKELETTLAKLRQENGKVLAEQARLREEEKAFTGATEELEKRRQELLSGVERLQKKLASIQPQGPVMRVFEWVRNAPLLDFMAPSLRIQQLVLSAQIRDINFISIPRVDRCQTCHLAADQTGFEDSPDRKSTRLNSSHIQKSRMPSSA